MSLVFALTATGQSPVPPTPPQSQTKAVPPAAANPLSIPELMRRANVPGMCVAYVRNAKLDHSNCYGVRNVQTREPVSADTVFEAASLSKPVFAYAVLKLVDQGKLDLDAPLSKYLAKPYLEGDPRIDKITARIVLSHRTGFPNWRPHGKPLTIAFEPGTRFSYSGEGFVYLQRVVEHITGTPLDVYMKHAVFEPLGMTQSSYLWQTAYNTQSATGHDVDGLVQPKDQPDHENAAASLQTTATDYARFVIAILQGVGLKPETLAQMETPQIAVDPSCHNCLDHEPRELSRQIFWGLGWGIEQVGNTRVLWHWGDNGSFKAFVAAIPRRKAAVVLLMNSENGQAIAPEIVKRALGFPQPAFDWLDYDRYDSPALMFQQMLREKGAEAALAQFEPAIFSGKISESTINAVGYRLMGYKKLDDAIRVFEINVKAHPDSWNAYDSLGEAYSNAGKRELAIVNYERSLMLNPSNDGGAEALKKLRSTN